MPDLIRQQEGEPTRYPDPPEGLSEYAAEIDPAVIWARLEDWVRHRWGERQVTWVVRGPGLWSPPLEPATVGHTDPPPSRVLEAHRRLVEYMGQRKVHPPAMVAQSSSMGDTGSIDFQFPTGWMAKAMQYSGAADLLRSFR